MPSIESSRQHVRAGLGEGGEIDHDAILASLGAEIDAHNAVKDELRDAMRGHWRPGRSSEDEIDRHSGAKTSKFRFKAGKRHRKDKAESSKRKKQRKTPPPPETASEDEETSHPFPREPVSPTSATNDAFRTSLFDALADDEGAAAYWESVYSQPIHTYPRPYYKNSKTGELEEMGDDEYVEYVKQRMWERKHPEIVAERKMKEKERRREEEERTRRREEFVRRKERGAWERENGPRRKKYKDDYDYTFAGEPSIAPRSSPRRSEEGDYAAAWSKYLTAWSSLLTNLPNQLEPLPKIIPWPTLSGKAATRPHIEEFMRHAPSEDKLRIFKAERVKWHPDKMQQRFSILGGIDDETMDVVTEVFRAVDGVLGEERKRM